MGSGTTDTYFTRDMTDLLKTFFKSMVRVYYNSNGMTHSNEYVNLFSSLIIQLNGYTGDTRQCFDICDPDAIPRLADKLDEEYPYDVLVVTIPNYYDDYNSLKKRYIPRYEVRGNKCDNYSTKLYDAMSSTNLN